MAIASMTGFGAGTATAGTEEVSVEIRSVNGKYCEVKARLPRELSSLEGDAVRQVKERLARGNVDVFVRRTSTAPASTPVVDAALVAAYAEASARAAKTAGIRDDLGIRDLLVLEGVVRLEERAPDPDAVSQALRAALGAALDALVASRRREGAALEADLRARARTLRELATKAAEAAPAAVEVFRERLHARVREVAGEPGVDPDRVAQEVVLYADRTDVAEELTRLVAHFDELDRVLAGAGAVGRRLDFLLQEVNREVNTIGSKSQSTDMARIVVEMKTELERVREQVQNVE